MLSPRVMSKYQSTPANEMPFDFPSVGGGSTDEIMPQGKLAKSNSGTALASQSRRQRLLTNKGSSGDGSSTLALSPGGSVLDRVSMFEAHNKKITISSPTRKAPGSPGAKVAAAVISPERQSDDMKLKLKVEKSITTPTFEEKHNNDTYQSSSKAPSTPTRKSSLSVNVKELKHDSTEKISNSNPLARYSPAGRRSQAVVPENKLISPSEKASVSPFRPPVKYDMTDNKDAASSSSTPSCVKTDISTSSSVVSATSSAGKLERRRKMQQAKMHAANSRANLSLQKSSSSNTPSRSAQKSEVAKKMSLDPLDREGLAKESRNEIALDADLGISLTASPNRQRKMKLAGDLMKKVRKNKGNNKSDDMSAPSQSSKRKVKSTSAFKAGTKSSPMAKAERNKKWEQLNFPDVDLGNKRSSPADEDETPCKSNSNYIVSPSSLPGKRDRSRLNMKEADLSSPFKEYGSDNGFTSTSTPVNDIDAIQSKGQQLESQFDESRDPQKTRRPTSNHKKGLPKTDHYDGNTQSQSSPGQPFSNVGYSSTAQTQHFFAPIVVDGAPNFNFHDEDDETQFNSVSMQDYDKGKSKDSVFDRSPMQNHHSPSASSKGTQDVSSYWFTGTGSPTKVLTDDGRGNGPTFNQMINQPSTFQNAHGIDPNRDDDAESYTGDSIANGSWTGRMRAMKKFEGVKASEAPVDMRMDKRLYRSGSKQNMSTLENSEDYISVANRSLSRISIQQKMACHDAKNGMDEIRNFATEDPKSVGIGLGVAGALCGAIFLGPVGIVLGAASAGVGYKVMQMPEDQRSEVKDSANTAINKLHDSAVAANETIQNSCASACGSDAQGANGDIPTNIGGINPASGTNPFGAPETVTVINNRKKGRSPKQDTKKRGMPLNISNLNPNPHDLVAISISEQPAPNKIRRLTPACCRMGRITPVGQIHSLDPALHPRAWLDVMANAWTSREEKNEAMEEILLLAKHRNHARMLLDEGILDSLMYIIRAFFLDYANTQRQTQSDLPVETYAADLNFLHAKLASNCCVALGKAHCAVAHSQGEEMISATVHVSVPLTKQVAQMLYEVPHHTAVKTNGEGVGGENQEVFKLTTEMSPNQAEALATSVTSLSAGKVELALEEI